MRFFLISGLIVAMLLGVAGAASYSPSFLGAVAKLQQIDELEHWISVYGVNRYEYWAFLIQESGGDRHHVSCRGAREVGQVMPRTRRNMQLQRRKELGQPSYQMSWVEAGVRYYWVLSQMFPTLAERAAAYNCGDARLRRIQRRHGLHWRQHLPPETARYVTSITANYQLLKTAGAEIEDEAIKLERELVKPGDGWLRLRERTRTTIFSLKSYNLHAAIFGLKAGDYVVFCERECLVPEPVYVQCEVDGQAQNCCEHIVQMGESLWEIAQLYGAKVRAIQRANSLGRRTTIHPGQKLQIPLTVDSEFTEHVVRRGQNPWMIARRYGIDLGQLLLDNQLTERSQIQPGQVLKIRKPEPKTELESPDITYRVRRGDNLGKISRRYGLSVAELMELNDLPDTRIGTSDQLVIARAEWYEVESGDSLSAIAVRFDTTTRQIMADNGLRSTRIKAGQKLRIRLSE